MANSKSAYASQILHSLAFHTKNFIILGGFKQETIILPYFQKSTQQIMDFFFTPFELKHQSIIDQFNQLTTGYLTEATKLLKEQQVLHKLQLQLTELQSLALSDEVLYSLTHKAAQFFDKQCTSMSEHTKQRVIDALYSLISNLHSMETHTNIHLAFSEQETDILSYSQIVRLNKPSRNKDSRQTPKTSSKTINDTTRDATHTASTGRPVRTGRSTPPLLSLNIPKPKASTSASRHIPKTFNHGSSKQVKEPTSHQPRSILKKRPFTSPSIIPNRPITPLLDLQVATPPKRSKRIGFSTENHTMPQKTSSYLSSTSKTTAVTTSNRFHALGSEISQNKSTSNPSYSTSNHANLVKTKTNKPLLPTPKQKNPSLAQTSHTQTDQVTKTYNKQQPTPTTSYRQESKQQPDFSSYFNKSKVTVQLNTHNNTGNTPRWENSLPHKPTVTINLGKNQEQMWHAPIKPTQVLNHHNPLSHDHIETILYQGNQFFNMHHILAYEQAIHYRQYQLSKQILHCSDQKHLDHILTKMTIPTNIQLNSKWEYIQHQLIKEILTLRTIQHQNFREALILTGSSKINSTVNDPYKPCKFLPFIHNTMGNHLMKIRFSLQQISHHGKHTIGTIQPTPPSQTQSNSPDSGLLATPTQSYSHQSQTGSHKPSDLQTKVTSNQSPRHHQLHTISQTTSNDQHSHQSSTSTSISTKSTSADLFPPTPPPPKFLNKTDPTYTHNILPQRPPKTNRRNNTFNLDHKTHTTTELDQSSDQLTMEQLQQLFSTQTDNSLSGNNSEVAKTLSHIHLQPSQPTSIWDTTNSPKEFIPASLSSEHIQLAQNSTKTHSMNFDTTILAGSSDNVNNSFNQDENFSLKSFIMNSSQSSPNRLSSPKNTHTMSTNSSQEPPHLTIHPISGPHKIHHTTLQSGKTKQKWQLKETQEKVLILGDRNVHGITKTPPGVNSIEIQAFDDLLPLNMIDMFKKDTHVHPQLKYVVLNLGIKNINNKTTTNIDQYKRLLRTFKKWQPTAIKAITPLQWPNHLLNTQQQANLKLINQSLATLASQYDITLLQPLYHKLFKLTSPPLQPLWTEHTANSFLLKWHNSLNFKRHPSKSDHQ